MSRFSDLGRNLYDGDVSINFVGRKWLWYALSAIVVAVSVYGLTVQKLNWGIEFEGGVEYRVAVGSAEATQENVETIREAVMDTGIANASAPIVNTSGSDNIRIQTEPLSNDEATQISEVIQDVAGVGPDAISQDDIGASWGQQVAERALTGLVVFLVLVILMIWAYFREWKMSVAAIVALAHDVIITVGVYALSGFEVTPATVTGVLTILGFSLYDTVVVFDKVRENTKNIEHSTQTYAEAANLAVNQTLVRSINTSVVAIIPVAALLYSGVVLLGAGALKDLALSLFVGMIAGVYSSVFIATPLLVQLKELEPGVKAGDQRARKRRERHNVDPFANVPVYREDMPVRSEPEFDDEDFIEIEVPETPSRSGSSAAPSRTTAGERPGGPRPVSDSASAHRPQPSRKSRSRRGKK